jgi:hypothetical protein
MCYKCDDILKVAKDLRLREKEHVIRNVSNINILKIHLLRYPLLYAPPPKKSHILSHVARCYAHQLVTEKQRGKPYPWCARKETSIIM